MAAALAAVIVALADYLWRVVSFEYLIYGNCQRNEVALVIYNLMTPMGVVTSFATLAVMTYLNYHSAVAIIKVGPATN